MFQAFPSLSSVVLTLSLLGGDAPPQEAPRHDVMPAGTFLEGRSAAVFAGACHYNAELVNSGDQALAAWAFERGSWEGVALGGTRAVVALAANKNLVLEGAERRAVLYLDAESDAQRAALTGLFRARYATILGELVAVRPAEIELLITPDDYRLAVPGVLLLEGRAMPDRACCSMPDSIWYRPLLEEDRGTSTAGVLVGYSEALRYHDAARDAERPVAPRWSRYGENDAFLGRFRLAPEPVLAAR